MPSPKTLEPFFTPKTIAVIGASNTVGKVGYNIFVNLKNSKVKKIFPINPKYKKVQGVKAYSSISELKTKIDMTVISIPAPFVPGALEDCMKSKVKGVVIVSAGFSEVGEKKLTKQIADLIKKYPKTRVIGPNCVGVINTNNNVDTTFFEKSRMKAPKKGNLSFISQSGALAAMIIDWVSAQEFGINKFVSYGNAMDVDEADLLEYFGQDKETKVITVYLEGARDGEKFYRVAKKVSKKKPIVVLKGGKNEQTRQAVASHTGSLAGSAKVYEAVFKQSGIIEADEILDLFNISKLLEKETLPKGNRVQIITNGGGLGLVAADQVISNDLKLSKLSKGTIKKLKKLMPKAIFENPIDLLGDSTVENYMDTINLVNKDKNVDIILVLILFNPPTIKTNNIGIWRKTRKQVSKPTIVCSFGSEFTINYMRKIEEAGFTTFKYPSLAAKALKELVEYSNYLKKN